MENKEYKENEEGKLSADQLNDDTLEAVNGGIDNIFNDYELVSSEFVN